MSFFQLPRSTPTEDTHQAKLTRELSEYCGPNRSWVSSIVVAGTGWNVYYQHSILAGMTSTLEEQLDQVARDIAHHNFAEFAELARREREYFTWSQADQEDFQQARQAGVAHLRDLLARKEELIRKLDAAKMA